MKTRLYILYYGCVPANVKQGQARTTLERDNMTDHKFPDKKSLLFDYSGVRAKQKLNSLTKSSKSSCHLTSAVPTEKKNLHIKNPSPRKGGMKHTPLRNPRYDVSSSHCISPSSKKGITVELNTKNGAAVRCDLGR